MTRKEREASPGESFDSGYHLYAEEKHNERVAKTPDRLAYAIERLEAHGIEYALKNEATGHLHCRRKTDDSLIQFYAGTGKIIGFRERGIHNLIRICKCPDVPGDQTEYMRGFSQALKEINTPMPVDIEAWSPSKCPRCGESFVKFEPCDDGYYNRAEGLGRCPYCGQTLCWDRTE